MVKNGVRRRAAQVLTRFEELIANDGQVRRQAVAYREDSPDTVRGARAHTTKVKITRVDREAISAERELDALDGETGHGPKTCSKKNKQKNENFFCERLGL